MAISDDLPPQITKTRTVRTRNVETLLSIAARAAHIARDKGYYIVSPEAIECVEALRMMRRLPLTPRLIKKTKPTLQFLARHGNPRIRSESITVLVHFKSLKTTRRG